MNNPNETPDVSPIPEDFAAYEAWINNRNEDALAEAPAASEQEQPESAPASEPDKDTQEKEEKAEEEKPEKKGGFQRRIDKLTREKHELAERLEALERRLADPSAAKPPAVSTPEGKPAAPKSSDFKTWDEYETARDQYQEALTDWKVSQREKAREEAYQKRQIEASQKTLAQQWAEKEAKAREAHPDYDEALEDAVIPQTQSAQVIRQALAESEIGPELAYYLAKNEGEAKRIAALSPIAAVREIGRLEAKLSAPPEDKKPAVSKAPKPPASVSGSSKPVSKSIYDDDLAQDFKAWERERNAQLKRK